MKVVAIVQARLSSQRLANKVLLPLEDKTVLGHIVDRLLNCKFLDEIVIATSTDASDKEIVDWCKINKINFFCGSLHDVLDRYYKASRKYNAKVIVRITGDCPVVDPEIVDEVIKGFFSGNYEAHIRNARDVPAVERLVEGISVIKHPAHICNARDVPS